MNPQDLNRYSYVADSPLRFIDPDGVEKIQIVVTTFIPQKRVTVPVTGEIFQGDDRNVGESGSYRTTQIITIETDPAKGPALVTKPFQGCGTTQELNQDGSPKGASLEGSGDSLEYAVTRGDAGVTVHVKGNEKDPKLRIAAGITYDLNINIQSPGTQGDATVTVSGGHDKFPAYEIYVNRFEQPKPAATVVYGYDPRTTGSGARQLIPYLPGNWNKINPPVRIVISGQSAPPPSPPPPPRRRQGKKGHD